jgi:putative ABC transport system permease protein
MTLTGLVAKNALRNRRRSIPTIFSIAFSILLLTVMMTLWRSFYIDQLGPASALRLFTRPPHVFFTYAMPTDYRQKIKSISGVVAVAPLNLFNGVHKDNKAENGFPQGGTDPNEFLKVYRDYEIPPDQVIAWQKDRAGAIVENALARQHGWKPGDRIVIQGKFFPVNLEPNIRGIYKPPVPARGIWFNWKYVEEAVPYARDDMYILLADSPQDVTHIESAVDGMFRNSPSPTRTETEKQLELDFISMLGNVKAFILSICGAVVFAILLVSANTIAMSIRERTREVALLKTLGFTRWTVLMLLVGEAVTVSLAGGVLGLLTACGLSYEVVHSEKSGVLCFCTGNPGNLRGGAGRGSHGRVPQRRRSRLPRLGSQYRRGSAPHRLSKLWLRE